MFQSYWKIALRSIAKNKLYAFINILGLAIGLNIYLFGGLLANYERSHDTMFKNHERIYTVGSELTENAGISVSRLGNTYSAMGRLIELELEEADKVARTINREYLLTHGDKHFHESVWFTDATLPEIFNFTYVQGNETALTNPHGIVLTRSYAEKIFGSTDILGKTVLLNHSDSLHVTAVIEDLPRNSHFNSSLINAETEILAPLEALNRLADWDMNGNWHNIDGGNQVYVMTKQPMALSELEAKLNGIFDRHVPEDTKQNFMKSLSANNITRANLELWDMVGMPVIETIEILGLLVLIIAIVNYTNLATAQSMGRAREVGMRKTLGANKPQLMAQFLVESLTTTFVAMVLAIVLLEVAVPQFNNALDKSLVIDYVSVLPWILATTLVVGLVSGAYPSFLITKVSPIDALKNTNGKGAKGSLFRSVMIGTQFVLSIFMLALVMIVFFQNQKVKESSNIFPKEEVLLLQRTNVDLIKQREDLLRNELLQLPGITSVTFASQVPFAQSNRARGFSTVKGDEDNEVRSNIVNVDHDFLKTFDIPLIAGRDFSREISSDERKDINKREANIIVNALFAKRLGFDNPQDIVGTIVWGMPTEQGAFQNNVIGVVEDQNFQGLHNEVKSWVFAIHPTNHRFGAIRIAKGTPGSIINDIEQTWKQVIPEYPIDHRYLDGLFERVYRIYKALNSVLAGFASIALLLALIGLFGLAAFMARGRTKEIGIRKVLGASVPQILHLILWQFSKPVMWAILFALPASYLASNMYLQFFAERISFQIPVIFLAGISAVGLAWGVIALHAVRVAKANPIKALRYE